MSCHVSTRLLKPFLIIVTLFIVAPVHASAAPTLKDARGTFVNAGEVAFGGQPPSLQTTLATIVRAALSLLGLILISLIIYAGYLWMTAGGDEKSVGKAKDIITQAIIGFAITLTAYAITGFVVDKLGAI